MTNVFRTYAPGGTLRVALNHGNRVLVQRDALGAPQGISVDLANALAEELGTTPVFVEYERAVDVAASADEDAWDVCFLAVDPARAGTVAFTPPYIRIEGCYLVAADSPAHVMQDIARLGLRIGAVEGSAYALHLARAPGAEGLVRFSRFDEALEAFDGGSIDGLAGIRPAMEAEGALRPGTRVITPPFMEIRHAMGVPTGRTAALDHLTAFLQERALDGTIPAILEGNGIARNCAIAPPRPEVAG